jgi:hypothetical protein
LPAVGTPAESHPPVRLVEWDPEAEARIAAGILFAAGDLSWDQALETARALSAPGLEDLYERYLGGRRARWYKAGRALENAYLRFEILMDIGSYRDLHRHRMMTQQRQLFSARHGYDIPEEITEAGLREPWSKAIERAAALWSTLAHTDPVLAQYAVPMACRVRFQQWQNLRQFFWETELRTVSQGHPTYRRIEQEKFRLVQERFPLLSRYVKADLDDYAVARRGTEERIREKEARIASRLGKGGNSP